MCGTKVPGILGPLAGVKGSFRSSCSCPTPAQVWPLVDWQRVKAHTHEKRQIKNKNKHESASIGGVYPADGTPAYYCARDSKLNRLHVSKVVGSRIYHRHNTLHVESLESPSHGMCEALLIVE